jgi:glutathione S-transferase
MLTLYHCRDARSFRALWMLEELELPYRLELLRFPPRVRDKGFLDLNPLGTVPLLIDGETHLTESVAICEYLAALHGDGRLAVLPGEPGYGAYLNALHQADATLTFPQTLVLRYGAMEPEERRLPQVVDDYGRWFAARLRAVERIVETRPFIAAGRFTAADVAVGYALSLADSVGLEAAIPPASRAYLERLQSREGYCRAKAAQKRKD